MTQKGRSLKEVQQRGHLYETRTIIDTVWTSHPCYTFAKQSRLSPSRPRSSRERRVDLDLWADNECHPSTAWAPHRAGPVSPQPLYSRSAMIPSRPEAVSAPHQTKGRRISMVEKKYCNYCYDLFSDFSCHWKFLFQVLKDLWSNYGLAN